MEQKTIQDRNSHFDGATRPLKRRKITSPDYMQSAMVPIMHVYPNNGAGTQPRSEIVERISNIIDSGLKTQKQIAKECGISPTKMSQFMNGALRRKGWQDTESILRYWEEVYQAANKSGIGPQNAGEQPELNFKSTIPDDNEAFEYTTYLLNSCTSIGSYAEEPQSCWDTFSIGTVIK